MSYIEQLEGEIAGQLHELKKVGFDVVELPDLQADFQDPVNNTQITVCYKKSEYADSRNSAEMSQEETAFIELVIKGKRKRGELGIYAAKLLIDKYLLGFVPTQFNRVYMVDFSFFKYENSLWHYSYIVACKGMVVERESENEYPLLKGVNLYDENSF